MEQTKLNKILENHKKWLNNETDGIRANLRSADLSFADLSFANLRSADLRFANLSFANLRSADLSSANLRSADLSSADLRFADLSFATLRFANLRSADLSQIKGLPRMKDFLSKFKHDEKGIFVYRIKKGENNHPKGWVFKTGNFLEETPNPDRGTECGSGVSFATLDWIKKNYKPTLKNPIWLCQILWEDMADVCVPFNTDGKARCARLNLIKRIKL